MTDKKNLTLLKVALAIFAVSFAVYGVCIMFFTNVYMDMVGGEPINPNWIRWTGGVQIALAYGAFRVLRNPVNQDIYVKVIALATLFIGLALLYELLFELEAGYVILFTILPCVVTLCISALLWIGRSQANDILKQE